MSNQKSKNEGQTTQWSNKLQRTRSTKHYTYNKRL